MDSRTNSCSQFNEVAYAETCLNKPLMLGSELKPHHSSQLLAYASYMTIFWAIKEGLGEEGKYPTPLPSLCSRPNLRAFFAQETLTTQARLRPCFDSWLHPAYAFCASVWHGPSCLAWSFDSKEELLVDRIVWLCSLITAVAQHFTS